MHCFAGAGGTLQAFYAHRHQMDRISFEKHGTTEERRTGSPVVGEDLMDVLDEQALGLGDEEIREQRHDQHPS